MVRIHPIFLTGKFLETDIVLSSETRYKAFTEPWVPNKDYDFKNDSHCGARTFRHQWLIPCTRVIADESADISGVEQLSIAIRFVDRDITGYYIRKKFLGFVPLERQKQFRTKYFHH
ncbi:hypothetical protein ILUMI_15795 [Ignelater luminosus]|uniref:Uncharacterized protein n=1 Tax=Ignelater luminosus TaxID=2038154 RepID=A0A8K0CMX7_IGNLU|nr:hypothetical protein ILUMI_15795 [Ignelater luminosus]